MASQQGTVLIVDQRDPKSQRSMKLRFSKAMTIEKLAKTYAKHVGASPDELVLTRPNGRVLGPHDAPPKSVFVVASADEAACRYCFEGRGELIAPCGCRGGQRYVHLECLRRWQRSLFKTFLIAESTHPALYREAEDPRMRQCGVCKSPFAVPPPTRKEMMVEFTGEEIAGQLRVGTVLGISPTHSARLERSPNGDYGDFVRSVYLLVAVEVDDGSLTLTLSSNAEVDALRQRLDETMSAVLENGRRFRLGEIRRRGGVVRGADCSWALRTLEAPAAAVLRAVEDRTGAGGDDFIVGVNLNAPAARTTSCRGVELVHRVGGVCGADRRSCLLVPGGDEASGFTTIFCGASELIAESTDSIASAAERAERATARAVGLASRRAREQAHGGVVGGQRVRVVGLREAAAYNGALGVAIAFAEARWRVRLPDGSLKSLRPENVESAEPRAFAGRVLVFWGDSRWSRTQLLGEVARRQWCVARATCEDVLAADRHARLAARGVSAAESEMADPGL